MSNSLSCVRGALRTVTEKGIPTILDVTTILLAARVKFGRLGVCICNHMYLSLSALPSYVGYVVMSTLD